MQIATQPTSAEIDVACFQRFPIGWGEELASEPRNSRQSGSLKLVRPLQSPSPTVSAKSSAIRRDVERVLSLHFQLDSFPFRTTIAALIRRGGDGGGGRSSGVVSESEMRLWKATVSAKLGHLPVSHRQALLDAAEQKFWIDTYRRDVRELSSTLGSPSGKAKLGARRRQVSAVREIAAIAADILADRRSSITRRRLYREALVLFHRAASRDPETRAYVFREPHSSDDQAQFSTCRECGGDIARLRPSGGWRSTVAPRTSSCGRDHRPIPTVISSRGVWQQHKTDEEATPRSTSPHPSMQ